MKRLLPLMVIGSMFLSSCSGENKSVEPIFIPATALSATPISTPIPTLTEAERPLPTSTPTLAPTPTLSPDTIIYRFDSNVSQEDQALIKEGVQIARHYLLNNFGSDIKGSYLIKVFNRQGSSDTARVNGEGAQQVLSLNVGNQDWIEDNHAWRLKVVMHEFTHLWQSEQGGGWPGCAALNDAVGLPGSHDPLIRVLTEGQAEYVGFMAADLEQDAFPLTAENLIPILSPVNRNLGFDYSVRKAGVYWLIKQKGPMAYSKYCSGVGKGETFADAFESGFGMTFDEFTNDFKQYLLDGLFKLCSQNSTCDKDKLATVWQVQQGCFAFITNSLTPPIDFLTIGYPRYIVAIASGKESEIDPNLALGVWQANKWKENVWFADNDVSAIAFKNLFDGKGVESFKNYCNAVAQGVRPQDAFKSAFGITIQGFRAQFKKEVLGEMANCTVATCGGGVDNYSDKYKLKHLIDKTKSTPNLILKFVDENNLPVALTHLSLSRQGIDGNDDYAQPFTTPETFSVSLLPGRYMFSFCEPGYPVDQSDFSCQMHETDWIDVYSDQVTNVTLQIPPAIENPSLIGPDLVVKFTDKDGNPVSNLGLQVCNYDTAVKVCNPTYPIGKTDANGVYKDSLRSGKYLIRVPIYPGYLNKYEFSPFYEIKEITVDETMTTTIDYQFPTPNLLVRFMDVNGSPIPEHGFLLCKMVQGVGDCEFPIGKYVYANKKGIFEAQVESGEYYILTCKMHDCPPPYDIKITNIVVVSETQVTTVEYSLYK